MAKKATNKPGQFQLQHQQLEPQHLPHQRLTGRKCPVCSVAQVSIQGTHHPAFHTTNLGDGVPVDICRPCYLTRNKPAPAPVIPPEVDSEEE